MEIVVVLIIVGIAAAVAFPNYITPTEQSRASGVRDNLLALYSAQQNYKNNFGGYCLSTSGAQTACNSISANCANNIASINCNLSLNIQNDGTYTYSCTGTSCTATRVGTASTNLVLTLNAPVNVTGTGTANPQCNTSNNWCPP